MADTIIDPAETATVDASDNSPPQTLDELRAEVESIRAEKNRTAEALKKSNADSERNRRRLKEIEDDEKAKRQAQLSEADRVKETSAEFERRATDAEGRMAAAVAEVARVKVDAAVEREAARAGFVYPEMVPSLIDRNRVEIDEDGKVVGVKDAVERLAKDKPLLLNAPRAGGSPQSIARRVAGNGVTEAAVDPMAEIRKAVRYPT